MRNMDKADAVILDIFEHENEYVKCFVLTVRDHFKNEHVFGFSYNDDSSCSWKKPEELKKDAFKKLCLAIYRYRCLCGEETKPSKYTTIISAAIDDYKKMLSESSFDDEEAESFFVELAEQKLKEL